MARRPITEKQRLPLYKGGQKRGRPPLKSNETIWEFLRGIETMPCKANIDNRKRRPSE